MLVILNTAINVKIGHTYYLLEVANNLIRFSCVHSSLGLIVDFYIS